MQLTIGEFIERLERMPSENTVYFDFDGLEPTGFASYRGFYDHLALGFREPSYQTDRVKAQNLLSMALAASKGIFTGWKGGEFIMHKDTPLWVANSGSDSGTKVIDVRGNHYMTIIYTERDDSYD